MVFGLSCCVLVWGESKSLMLHMTSEMSRHLSGAMDGQPEVQVEHLAGWCLGCIEHSELCVFCEG